MEQEEDESEPGGGVSPHRTASPGASDELGVSASTWGFREGLASFINHRDVSCGVPFPWTAQTQGNPPSPRM